MNRIVAVNGDGSETELTGEGITSCKVTLDVAMTIKAYFEKKPVVTYRNEVENGDITAQASSVNKASGDYVEFGSTVQLNITPDAGYIIDKVEMTSGGTTTEAELEMAGGESDAATVTIKDIQLNAIRKSLLLQLIRQNTALLRQKLPKIFQKSQLKAAAMLISARI